MFSKRLLLLGYNLLLVAVHGQIGVDSEVIKKRSFELDGENNQFLKDGVPFRYVSGTIHYFRIQPDSWKDGMRKMKQAGCNALQTYIEWSSHEPESGEYDFRGALDIFRFLTMAQSEGFLVILRPGPYIDAERDMGGLPYWLLRENPVMKLRSSDASYLYFVDRWFGILFPLLRPFMYENGGPIIMVQIENEYGSYDSCDFRYTTHLRDLARSLLGTHTLLFTTDGHSTNQLKCGKIAGVYATVDFGPEVNVREAFRVQRLFEPQGPLVNSEFYPGWIDHWGEPHSTRSIEAVTSSLDRMLSMNASVNLYVFRGGTAFGFKAGSNMGDRFQPCTTSYDFDAPLTEAGDPTEKYFAIRNVLKKYVPVPPGPVPGPSLKKAYGPVVLHPRSSLLDLTRVLKAVSSEWPQTFEAISVSNGIVVYSTRIPRMTPDPARLSLYDVHDRGYVFVEERFTGLVSREQELYDLPIFAFPNQTLNIVVESQGRICYGKGINDFKGLTKNVTLGTTILSKWNMIPMPLLNTSRLYEGLDHLEQKRVGRRRGTSPERMAFYQGVLQVPQSQMQPKDTFLRLDGWAKGYAWINDFLLGRYWPSVGPQETLYVPRSALKRGKNTVLILELERSPCLLPSNCKVRFVDSPVIDGPTPHW